MRPTYRYALGLTVISITHCVVAQSQIPTARGMTSDHRYEVAATYSHVLTDGSFGRPNLGMNGFAASMTAGVLPLFQLTGDVGAYSRSGISLKSFLGGPQLGFHLYRFQPFIHVLAGISHTTVNSQNRGNAFTVAAGGGLNVPITPHVAIRALQAEYYRPFGGFYKSADFLRLGFGLSYQFGVR